MLRTTASYGLQQTEFQSEFTSLSESNQRKHDMYVTGK
jgi:hypothetical protein